MLESSEKIEINSKNNPYNKPKCNSSLEEPIYIYRGDLNLNKHPPPEKDITDVLKR